MRRTKVILVAKSMRMPCYLYRLHLRCLPLWKLALFWLSAYKNVELAVKQNPNGRSKKEMKEWVEHNLELVHMSHAVDKLPAEISGGM
jgi:ABC-type transporter Mla maintaining outer membrane lipid asymmetry ATPase subunit MlaF